MRTTARIRWRLVLAVVRAVGAVGAVAAVGAVGASCGGGTGDSRGKLSPSDPNGTPGGKTASPPPPGSPVAAPAPGAPGAAAAQPTGPVREKAAAFREAADLLDKADAARERGNKSFAEQLFSSAELIVGADALADLAQSFRAGAPPRVTTPTKPVAKDAPPQPVAVGRRDDASADVDEGKPDEGKLDERKASERKPSERKPEGKAERKPRRERGSLSGAVTIDGKSIAGELGAVTLEPASGRRALLPVARVVEQRNRQFAPRLLVVPVGSTVSFPNFDPIFHNVFSTSEAKPFDLGLYKIGEAREVVFDKEGMVRIGCNLHANMSATVMVVAAPYFTITDSSGRFTFENLEPGKYLLRGWSERSSKMVSENVEVKPGKNAVNLGVAGDAPSGPLPDKFGVPRAAKKP
jgi:plastocyanin